MDKRDLYEAIMLIAENDGDAYKHGKDAAGAVERALRDYQRIQAEGLRADLREIKTALVRDLYNAWKED